ncbi:MAM and LDL-receptor class A domain-containing protein 1-like [Hypomesus transpacificus]|uniref:MAM and LDL-receptor class A domain-containing protein 1-like n=1 Tax=Hypomesus transpacificus TaxID=137520 RepID=UPI001F072177|nr:MAM and LDL-receptor class A domain-containing protein 1-like [Hypomesus transpacificus]
MDCDDGSDEEFCGSCDFEGHSCGWNDTSKDVYRWRLERANVTSVPGHDHTTGSPRGHVIGVNGTQETSIYSEAILEYYVDKPGALGCQIRFWYHIQGERSPTSHLYLKMVRQTEPKELVKISKDRTNGWENSTAFLGNQPGGFKLVFSTKPPLYPKDVMLDDIHFESCWEGDEPAGSDVLTCDFEKDTCAWYRDHTAALMWERSNRNGPGYDHTIGKEGYFMFIAAKSGLNVSSTARLISYPQQARGTLCVSFWYHIYGTSIGSLKFITKQAGEPESVVWMRSGTQGHKWRFADLTFSSDTPIQFILEAVVGGRSGSIAIDDVEVFHSENASCPAEKECTFQGSLCGLQADLASDFPWSRTRGAQTGNSPSPDTDHTLGTELGFYLSAQLWRHHIGTRGRMVTAVNEPTPHSGECWRFWYHMEGRAELRVYLQTLGSPSSPPSLLWSRAGDQGEHWRQARATVLSPNAQYQVIFEAVVGEGSQRDIAIDDLTLLNGPCPEQGFCDFEMDYCGWVNSPPAGSGVDWDWVSGGGRFMPPVDHTTNSALGHFVIFSADRGEEKAHLQSERVGAVERACLGFWFYMEMWSRGLELSVYVNETEGLRSVWSKAENKGQIWHRAMVDYKTTGTHQIVFEATNLNKEEGGIALDDVHILLNTSCADLLPTTPPPPTTPAPTPPPSPMDCNFEQGLCRWVQGSSDDVDWLLHQGAQVNGPWDGPLYDHTLNNKQGFYLLLNGSGTKDGEAAVISVPVDIQTTDVCVGFWYYMLGASVSSLELLVQAKSSRAVVWTRSGTQDSDWVKAQVTVSHTDIMEVMFSGRRDTRSTGFIAIDDFTMREGACLEQNPCGFESHTWCDFDVDVTHRGRWGRIKGTTDGWDHTLQTDSGFYLTVLKQSEEVAQILTPELDSTMEMCLRFW